MASAEPIYICIMAEIERRRRELGLPMWEVNELAGTAERYYAKILHTTTPSGRQARWPVVQEVLDALFPLGFELTIREIKSDPRATPYVIRRIKTAAELAGDNLRREVLRANAKHASLAAAAARQNIPPERRSEISRRAAQTRYAERDAT